MLPRNNQLWESVLIYLRLAISTAQLQRMVRKVSSGHHEQFADTDLGFHRTLVVASGHRQLLAMWETLTNVVHPFIVLNANVEPDIAKVIMHGHRL